MNPMNNTLSQRQFTWDDLPECIATIAALVEGIDQCSLTVEGRPGAHLLLSCDGLLSITEVYAPEEIEPDQRLMLAIGRILIAHRRANKEGRSLLS